MIKNNAVSAGTPDQHSADWHADLIMVCIYIYHTLSPKQCLLQNNSAWALADLNL